MIVSCIIFAFGVKTVMIILASASPRRKDILSELGVPFTVITADTNENCDECDPCLFVKELAERKGMAVYQKLSSEQSDAIIISADTVVYCDGKILGKPRDEADAIRMISSLSGKEHSVISGVAITIGGKPASIACSTRVRVRDIPKEKIEEYVATGESMDKAGAYAIQGRFSVWIDSIDGCYFNVVGLPVSALNKLYFDVTGKYII